MVEHLQSKGQAFAIDDGLQNASGWVAFRCSSTHQLFTSKGLMTNAQLEELGLKCPEWDQICQNAKPLGTDHEPVDDMDQKLLQGKITQAMYDQHWAAQLKDEVTSLTGWPDQEEPEKEEPASPQQVEEPAQKVARIDYEESQIS